jgi:uncharacterized protein (TIGR00251 family)
MEGTPMPPCVRLSDNQLFLNIKAVPGSSKSALAGISGDRLRVKIAAAPEDGRANGELCAFLSKLLGCAKKDIRIAAGEKSKLKTLSLPVIIEEKLKTLLEAV